MNKIPFFYVNDEFQSCKNWSNNVCFILCFSHSMLLKVCVCHILEKPVSFNIFSKHFILSLFDQMVKPILLYGCEIWGFGNNDLLEKVHLKFCKMILNLKTSTPNYMIYGELGRYPVENCQFC
jgi:hypothetical protein